MNCVTIIHETHRGKFSFSTTATLALLEVLPDFQLTTDFSHGCIVAESFLQDQPEAMQAVLAAPVNTFACRSSAGATGERPANP